MQWRAPSLLFGDCQSKQYANTRRPAFAARSAHCREGSNIRAEK